MATKPTFSPDQDMDNVTPQDLQDAKTRTRERRAYNEASGNLPKNENEARAKIQKQISLTPKNTYSGENTNAMGDAYAKGGSASSRADGIAQRGKTKGTMVMCGGGMTKR
jgi:hypothetical protein